MSLTQQEFLGILLAQIAAKSGIPTPEKVEEHLDALLPLMPHLVGVRKVLLDAALTHVVTAVGRFEVMDDEEHVRWLDDETAKTWAHWPWLKGYLETEVRRPTQVMKELDESTKEVIDLLGDPKRPGVWDRRGLVVGHVQSGKTQHYTALAAKALDAGFKLVIILSGIHENLRQQTQERVEEVVIGKDSRNQFAQWGVRLWANKRLPLKIAGDPTRGLPEISQLTSVAGDYGAVVNRRSNVVPGEAPVILVIKKNASILKNLLAWVDSHEGPPLRVPTLVIDDEADHSSINTADPETDPTTINWLIRVLLWHCDRVGFVGYTATPYANIFMDDEHVEKRADRQLDTWPRAQGRASRRDSDQAGSDLFPRSFIVNLASPTNYIGPEAVFGHDGDETLGIPRRPNLPMHVPADDAEDWLPAKHKSDFKPTANLPNSLREALRSFLLSAAARMALGQTTDHMSMLVHVSRFNDVQEIVEDHVESDLSSLIERLNRGEPREAEEEWLKLRDIWNRVFEEHFRVFAEHPSQQQIKPVLPPWESVRAQVNPAFARMTFANINSTTKENLDYKGAKRGLVVVAVGGDRLSRGLTLEGLSVSYFLRGARAYDTLMQMGRWFGYRPGYAHLCRVYAPHAVKESFRSIALATEELRREFSRMAFLGKRPSEYGLRVREPRADLLVTAMNKMRRGETVRVHFAESLVSSLDIPKVAAAENHRALMELLDALKIRHGAPVEGSAMASGVKGSYHYRWEGVGAEHVVRFFSRYRANANVCFQETADRSTMVAQFVESMNRQGELTSWTVALVARPDLTRRRQFGTVNRNIDAEKAKTRPDQYVFRGVAMGKDEAIDLTREERDEAVRMYGAADEATPEGTPVRPTQAELFRSVRPASRGLLLLYPILPQEGDEEQRRPMALGELDSVVGVAVSFPSSRNDTGQDYVCNPRMLAELYGAELAEDMERDAVEDASLTS